MVQAVPEGRILVEKWPELFLAPPKPIEHIVAKCVDDIGAKFVDNVLVLGVIECWKDMPSTSFNHVQPLIIIQGNLQQGKLAAASQKDTVQEQSSPLGITMSNVPSMYVSND